MTEIILDPEFLSQMDRVKYLPLKIKVFNQIKKIKENPLIGKPMRYRRKGTREVYIKPYRLSYKLEQDTIYILGFYHKNEQ